MRTEDKETTAAQVCSCGTSVVCMAQMGTMGAASSVSMGGMSTATLGSLPFVTQAFQTAGLGVLLVLPPTFYQILLIVVLGFTVISSYYSYRFHRNSGPFGFALIGSLLIYASIYVFVSEFVYWIAFLVMSTSTGWNYIVTKKQVRRTQPHHLTIVRTKE